MKLCTALVAALMVGLTVGTSTATAADLYWDINGATPGATNTPPEADGTWDLTTNLFWSDDPDGDSVNPTTAWVNGNRAVFSAGTDANGTIANNGVRTDVTLGVTGMIASGILLEEGEIALVGSQAVTVSPGGIVDINAGAILSTNSSARIAAAVSSATVATVQYRLNGTTALLKSTNAGFAGSFVDVDAQIVLNGGGQLVYDGGAQINILQVQTGVNPAAVTGTGPLVVDAGTGALAIAGLMNYTGATIVNGGELRIRTTGNRLPIGTDLTVNSPGVMNINGVTAVGGGTIAGQEVASISGTGNIGTAGATLGITGSANTTFDGAVKDTANFNVPSALASGALFGRIIRGGSGVTTFNGINDVSGSVTINSGGIIVSATGSLCGDVADLTVNGGTLDLNNTAEAVENLSGTGGTITLGAGHTLTTNPSQGAAGNSTYSGTIAGAGGLRKTNNIIDGTVVTGMPSGVYRTLTLTGANTYGGGTEVSGGRLHANSATAIGSGTATINGNGVLAGNGTVSGAVTVQSGGHLGGGLGDAAGAVLTVGSTIDLQAGGHIDAVLGASGSALTGDYNGNGVVDGADYVVWRNGGSPDSTVAGYNAWRGNFGATGGGGGLGTSDYVTSTLANGLTIAPGSILTLLGGATAPSGTYTALQYTTGHTGTLASMHINNATGFDLTSVVDNATAKTFEVTVSGTVQNRSWAAAGSGNWSANPAEAGNWSPSGQPNGPGAIGTFAGAGARTVTITDSDKTLGTMTLNNSSGYDIAASGAYRLNMNTYTGTPAINVTSGSHTISAPVILSKATTATVSNASDTLTVSGTVANVSGLTKAGPGNLVISGVMNGTGGTFTNSAGTTTLSAANLYTGVTTNAAGATLNVTNAGLTSGTGTGAVTNNGTLNVADGRITGAVTTNSGGITNVTGGTTAEANLSATTIVNGGGTLTGTGAVAGITLTTTQNGTLEPGGIGAVGELTATGTVTFGASSVFKIDLNDSGAADLLTMTSATATTGGLVITAGATMVINDVDGAGILDTTYTILNYNVASNAVETNWAVSGPAGHSYTLVKDATNTLINLVVAPAGLGSGGAVPEPASIGLVAIAIVAFAGRRSRRA